MTTTISIVIPAARWDDRLDATLDTVFAQRLPEGVSMEVAVAIGGGSPGEQADGRVLVVDNPGGSIPVGLNRCIAATTGEVVVRVDARCLLAPDHLVRVVQSLEDPAIGCVGGAALVLDRGVFGSAYAIAFNGGLLGPSPYRYRRRSGPVDTAYLGAWRRSTLTEIGGFDEQMTRNQDNELAQRIRDAGLTVWYDADIVVGYWNDRDLHGAVVHHRAFGRWRTIQASNGQPALSTRQKAVIGTAGLCAVALVVGTVHPRTRRFVVPVAAAGYLTASVVATGMAGRLRRARPDLPDPCFHLVAPLIAPAIAGVIDAAWSWGLVEPALARKANPANMGAPPPTRSEAQP